MSGHDFTFVLRVSASGGLGDMLDDLTGNVLRHVGYRDEAVASLGGEVKAAIEAGARSGVACDLRFRAHQGALEIVVTQDGHDLARIARRLPS